jgi:hypothetical protein
MKKLILLLLFPITMNAQVVLYSNDFTNGSAGWALDQGNNLDTWAVNDIYNCSVPTPDQGGGNYLHITDDLNSEYCASAVFLGIGSGGTCYATMTNGVNTQSSTADTIKFDWLCVGQSGPVLPSYGTVSYTVNGGATWNTIALPQAQYSGQNSWTTTIITSAQVPVMLLVTDFRLRFGFVNSGYGTNPAFAIDNLIITGGLATGTPYEKDKQSTIISPNPASDVVCISNPAIEKNNTSIRVFNALGNLIIVDEYDYSAVMDGHLSLNLEKLPAGYYFIEIQSPTQLIPAKVLKSKN